MQQASRANTPNECAKLEEQRNVLHHHLNSWMEVWNQYVPPTPEDHAATSSTESEMESPHAMSVGHLPEVMPLRLPSALPASLQHSCPFKLTQIKLHFCLAQAEDSLSELHRLLRVTMGLQDYKVKQIRPSQHAGTHACNLINRFKDKVTRCAEHYRAAQNALLALDPMGEWQTALRQLNDNDIRAPGRSSDESEGFHEVSWIWLVARWSGLGEVSSLQQQGPLNNEELDGCKHTSQ